MCVKVRGGELTVSGLDGGDFLLLHLFILTHTNTHFTLILFKVSGVRGTCVKILCYNHFKCYGSKSIISKMCSKQDFTVC